MARGRASPARREQAPPPSPQGRVLRGSGPSEPWFGAPGVREPWRRFPARPGSYRCRSCLGTGGAGKRPGRVCVSLGGCVRRADPPGWAAVGRGCCQQQLPLGWERVSVNKNSGEENRNSERFRGREGVL